MRPKHEAFQGEECHHFSATGGGGVPARADQGASYAAPPATPPSLWWVSPVISHTVFVAVAVRKKRARFSNQLSGWGSDGDG